MRNLRWVLQQSPCSYVVAAQRYRLLTEDFDWLIYLDSDTYVSKQATNILEELTEGFGASIEFIDNEWFKKFVQLWGINQEDIWKNFDVICGTSIGGMMALALALGLTPDSLTTFFTTSSKG